MNETSRLARRYHWHSATVRDFTADPHTAIVGQHAGTIRNLVDRRARPAQAALLTIARADPAKTLADVRRLEMPTRHDVRAVDVNEKRLGAVLALAHERDLRDFASFLLLEQLGARTLQSLDESISVLRRALDAATVGPSDKLHGLSRLDAFARAIEQRRGPEADVAATIAHERAISPSLGGRTVFDDPGRGSQTVRPRRGQLDLFPA
jgi:hypothetical protein